LTVWAARTADGWLLSIHVQPGAKRTGVAGLHGSALKVRVAAPPVAGKANAALEAFVAERLGVARSRVRVVRGELSREKRIAVSDPAADPTALVKD
jgi:uncharacterized protein (TIGR00251 family)